MCSHDENWASNFVVEAEKLNLIFKHEIEDMHHIGSTSVPGLKAKPIIDILPVVKDIKIIDKYNEEMQFIGYEPKGENGIPGRRYFQKGGDNRSHHVRISDWKPNQTTPGISRLFAKFSRCKEEYGELKERLAQQIPFPYSDYGGVFILQICDNCNKQFSWSKIYKSIWWSYKKIYCDHCGTKHNVTIYSIFSTIGMGTLICIVGSLFTPYAVKYKEVS